MPGSNNITGIGDLDRNFSGFRFSEFVLLDPHRGECDLSVPIGIQGAPGLICRLLDQLWVESLFC